jgi:hypothetical protein
MSNKVVFACALVAALSILAGPWLPRVLSRFSGVSPPVEQ